MWVVIERIAHKIDQAFQSLQLIGIGKLSDHYKIIELERIIAGDKWVDCGLIFPSTIGTPIGPSNLVKQFKNDLKKAGLPNIRFHDLRHTAATLMLQQGIHPKVVQERLGHSQISMTLDLYSHVLPSMQEDAAEKLDELFMMEDVTAYVSNQMS